MPEGKLSSTLAVWFGCKVNAPPASTRGAGAEAVKFTVVVPLFVTCTATAFGGFAVESAPKNTVGGEKVTVLFTAAATSSFPDPCAPTGASFPLSVSTFATVVLTRADLICTGFQPGCFCFTSAAAPAVIGLEKLVPEAAA